jgi:colicin import membrane protein
MGTELAIIEEIKEEKWPEIYGKGNVNQFYEKVKDYVSKEVPDVTTDKGRKAIASLSGKVSSSKTAVEKPGRDYLRKIKELPKTIEAELREFVTLMDKLRDDVRQPLTDYEADQARIKAEKETEEARKALLIQIENDHEIALLLNEKFDRELAEKKAADEKARIEYEEIIAANAAELARQALLARQEQERRDAQLAIERAQREKAEAEARERQAKVDADAREAAQKAAAELAIKQAAEKAERDRLQAIADTEARIAREKAEADAIAAKQAANKANQKKKNNEAKYAIMNLGLDETKAIELITAIARGQVPNITINY